MASRRDARLLALLALLVLLAGCAAGTNPAIVRRVGGERRQGAFVSPFSYEWYIRGELAFSRGDLDEAAEGFEMALAGPELDPFLMARLADVLDRLGQRARADRVLAEALSIDPQSEAAWLAQGQIAERRGDVARAIDSYERAEQSAPLADTAPLELARLLRDVGAVARAEAVLARYARRAGGGSAGAARARLQLALARDDGVAAAQAVDSLLRVAPASTEEVRAAAEAALRSGEPLVAARLLDRLPRRRGDEPLRVNALIAAGRTTEAEAILTTATPETFGGLVATGKLFLAARRPERAEEIAEAALALSATPDALILRARARLGRRDYVGAAEDFARVPAGTEDFVDARLGLADALVAGGYSGLAAETLAAALRDGGSNDARVRMALARLRAERGDLASAIALLDADSSVQSRATRAHLLDLAGQTAAAAAAYAALAVDDPTLPAGVRARARAERLVRAGRVAQAIGVLRRWAARAPEDTEGRTRLAELLALAGRRVEAKRVAESTLAVTPERNLRERLFAVTAQRGTGAL